MLQQQQQSREQLKPAVKVIATILIVTTINTNATLAFVWHKNGSHGWQCSCFLLEFGFILMHLNVARAYLLYLFLSLLAKVHPYILVCSNIWQYRQSIEKIIGSDKIVRP